MLSPPNTNTCTWEDRKQAAGVFQETKLLLLIAVLTVGLLLMAIWAWYRRSSAPALALGEGPVDPDAQYGGVNGEDNPGQGNTVATDIQMDVNKIEVEHQRLI